MLSYIDEEVWRLLSYSLLGCSLAWNIDCLVCGVHVAKAVEAGGTTCTKIKKFNWTLTVDLKERKLNQLMVIVWGPHSTSFIKGTSLGWGTSSSYTCRNEAETGVCP